MKQRSISFSILFASFFRTFVEVERTVPSGRPLGDAKEVAIRTMEAMQWPGSGKLPHKTYTVAERLGEGSCGAVRTVYDEDGTVFAL
jgi:hypothetical protein